MWMLRNTASIPRRRTPVQDESPDFHWSFVMACVLTLTISIALSALRNM